MTYIRTKLIGKHRYAYLVENIPTPAGPRQKVKQYFGRVYEVKRTQNTVPITAPSTTARELLLKIIPAELQAYGFQRKGKTLQYHHLSFHCRTLTLHKMTQTNTKKEAVLRLNEGYLCAFTLQQISSFKKTTNVQQDGYTLAKCFMDAGLTITPEQFITFYTLVQSE